MKYIYLNLIAFFGFLATYFAFQYGYFLSINNSAYNFPRPDFLNLPFFLITDIGGLIFISLISIFLVSFLVTKGKYRWAFYSTAALFGGLVSQTIIKNSLAVGRPEGSIASTIGYSFPSGHTNMATILFLSICLYVFSSIKDVKKRKKYFIFSITLIVLIGFSRIYLNTHWVSDVLAGWCLGLFWATAPKAVNNFVIFKHKFLK